MQSPNLDINAALYIAAGIVESPDKKCHQSIPPRCPFTLMQSKPFNFVQFLLQSLLSATTSLSLTFQHLASRGAISYLFASQKRIFALNYCMLPSRDTDSWLLSWLKLILKKWRIIQCLKLSTKLLSLCKLFNKITIFDNCSGAFIKFCLSILVQKLWEMFRFSRCRKHFCKEKW